MAYGSKGAYIQYQINGMDDLFDRFHELDNATQKSYAREAMLAGARHFVQELSHNWSKVDRASTPAAIWRAVAFEKFGGQSRKKYVGVRIGIYGKWTAATGGQPNTTTFWKGENTLHWRFIEFGFNHIYAGWIKPNPIMRKTFLASYQKATSVIMERLSVEMAKHVGVDYDN